METVQSVGLQERGGSPFSGGDDEFETLVLAQHFDGAGHSLEIRPSFHFDEQDVRLGSAKYFLVVDGGPTHYDGVLGWRLLEVDWRFG